MFPDVFWSCSLQPPERPHSLTDTWNIYQHASGTPGPAVIGDYHIKGRPGAESRPERERRAREEEESQHFTSLHSILHMEPFESLWQEMQMMHECSRTNAHK
ncbi:unnamed protein product [Pleuronectes platessa]|uniref:Uncharacterized protein n=1 Tax=Pleuronectes platessa TaxID=8262 RepID=A0A9N7VR32_PLEPL|nr:unnamed protein product [Pleuronectes platessa]